MGAALISAALSILFRSPGSVSSKTIDPGAYARINIGMTAEETEAAIGLPPGDHRSPDLKAANSQPMFMQVTVDESQSMPYWSDSWKRRIDWIGDDYTISVTLDDTNTKVNGKCLYRPFLKPERKPWWKKMWSWLF
jgi:hypothetical protein